MRSLLAASYVLVGGLMAAFLVGGQPFGSDDVSNIPSEFRQTRAVADLHRIEALTGPEGRPVGSRGNERVRTYIGEQLQKAGLEVSQQEFNDPLGGAIVSIIGQLPGTREEAVMLCGHHDTASMGPSPDGASGLAVMLEIARTAAARAKREASWGLKRRAILFVSWDGESVGCAGSSHFVRTLLPKERSKLRAVVSLDSLGGSGSAPVLHVLPYTDRFGIARTAPDWLVLKMARAARGQSASISIGDPTLGLGYQMLVQAVDVGYYSDDRPFLAAGIPSVFLSSFSVTRSSNGTPARPVDPDVVGSVGRSIDAAIADLTAAESLPAGESQYVVLQPPGVNAVRLTSDQIKTLALLGLLPGCFALVHRHHTGRLRITRALFFASITVFLAGLVGHPVLIGVLFGPSFLAAPLLAVSHRGAVLAYAGSLVLPLVFAAVLAPLFLTGSASLVTLAPHDLASIGGLLTIALIQIVMLARRSRRASRTARAFPIGPEIVPSSGRSTLTAK